MIFITGDCHSDFRRLNFNNFEDQKDMDKSDYVIICGDFGGIFSCNWDDDTEKFNLDWLEKKRLRLCLLMATMRILID